MAKPDYDWFVECANCGRRINLGGAASKEEPLPSKRSVKIACPHCGTAHGYRPNEMQLGELEKEIEVERDKPPP